MSNLAWHTIEKVWLVVYICLFGLGFCPFFLTFSWSQLQGIYYANKMKRRNRKPGWLCFLYLCFYTSEEFYCIHINWCKRNKPCFSCLKLALGFYLSGKQRQCSPCLIIGRVLLLQTRSLIHSSSHLLSSSSQVCQFYSH